MTQHCVEWNDTISYIYISVCSFPELVAHSNAIFDLAWLPGGTKLVGFTMYYQVTYKIIYCRMP